MTNAPTTEKALARLVDEAAVRDTIVRFADIATRGDFDAFRTLWSDDATWIIGGTDRQPFERRADGIDQIAALYRTLREERDYFIQFVIPGAIDIDGDTATTRSMCHEAARGPGQNYYRNNGIWTDTFRRTDNGWVFTNRTFQYLWLDFSPFTGDISWPGTDAR
ncbi:nuclear transport factor 2 family protein [Actinoplanes sp. NPDC000266]